MIPSSSEKHNEQWLKAAIVMVSGLRDRNAIEGLAIKTKGEQSLRKFKEAFCYLGPENEEKKGRYISAIQDLLDIEKEKSYIDIVLNYLKSLFSRFSLFPFQKIKELWEIRTNVEKARIALEEEEMDEEEEDEEEDQKPVGTFSQINPMFYEISPSVLTPILRPKCDQPVIAAAATWNYTPDLLRGAKSDLLKKKNYDLLSDELVKLISTPTKPLKSTESNILFERQVIFCKSEAKEYDGC